MFSFRLKNIDLLLILIALFIFLLPFYIGPTIRYIFSGLITSLSIFYLKKEGFLLKNLFAFPINLLILLLFFFIVLSIPFSPELSSSLKHVICEYCFNFLLFFAVSSYFFFYKISAKDVNLVFLYINIFFIVIYLFVLIQWMLFPNAPFLFDQSEFYLKDFSRSDLFFLFGNVCDLFTTIKHISLFIVLMIGVAFSNLILENHKKICMVLLFFDFFILFNITRRGAMLATFLGILFCTIMSKRYTRHLVVFSLLLICFLSLFFITGNKRYIVRENWSLILQGNIQKAKELGGSIPLRISTYKIFLDEILDAPFRPHGPSMKLFKKYYPDLIKKAGLTHGHNVFIDFAIQFGVQGALLLLIIIIYQFVMFYKGFSRTKDLEMKILFLSSMAFLIMFWTTNMFTDGFIHGSSTLYWLFTGISCGYAMNT